MEGKYDLSQLRDKVLDGGQLNDEEAYALLGFDSRALRDAAAAVTARFHDRHFDSCSIVNVRSGRCPENCKWCAQSAHYQTGCETYDLIAPERCLQAAELNRRGGVGRLSLVASGKSSGGRRLDAIVDIYNKIREHSDIYACASLGLLEYDDLRRLRDAGVRRYHCNLETAPSHFVTLCSTHTQADKLRTIRAAHALGMDVCSGGIIGMGETARQRVEFALALRQARPVSIPINILIPIPGTPLQDTPPITDDEILDTVAVFRLVHPRAQLRFAGGRKGMCRATQLEAMRIGINGAIVGDLLTTIGSTLTEDREMATQAGYEF